MDQPIEKEIFGKSYNFYTGETGVLHSHIASFGEMFVCINVEDDTEGEVMFAIPMEAVAINFTSFINSIDTIDWVLVMAFNRDQALKNMVKAHRQWYAYTNNDKNWMQAGYIGELEDKGFEEATLTDIYFKKLSETEFEFQMFEEDKNRWVSKTVSVEECPEQKQIRLFHNATIFGSLEEIKARLGKDFNQHLAELIFIEMVD